MNGLFRYSMALTSFQVELLRRSCRGRRDSYLPDSRAYYCLLDSGYCPIGGCRSGVVYVAKSGDSFKIGYTSRGGKGYYSSLVNRMKYLPARYGVPEEFLFGLLCNCAQGLEEFLHYRLLDYRVYSQFPTRYANSPEVYYLSPDMLDEIKAIDWFNGHRVIVAADTSIFEKYHDHISKPTIATIA